MVETRLRCSYDYARDLRPELSELEFREVWERIVNTGRRFDNLYLAHTPQILARIPSCSGFAWEEYAPGCIDIYLADFAGPSRTNPVTIKINKSLEKMLLILVHELTHLNMPNQVIPTNGFLYEDIVNQIALKVTGDLSVTCSLGDISFYRESLASIGQPIVDIPLGTVSVKEYFNNLSNGDLL